MNLASFPLGPFAISIGGLLVFCGILLAATILIRTVRDESVSLRFLSDHLSFFVLIPLFVGRLGAFLSLWPSVHAALPEDFLGASWQVFQAFFLIGDGGIRADWAVGGFFLTFLILALWRKQPHAVWLDTFILPGIIISLFVSLGGFFAGWNYGSPAPDWLPFPLSVQYDLIAVRYSVPLYAVQIYSVFFLSLFFYVGWKLWKRKVFRRWPAGRFFAMMIFFLGLLQFFLEFFRGDPVSFFLGMRLPQVFSVLLVFGSAAFLIFQRPEPLRKRLQRGWENF